MASSAEGEDDWGHDVWDGVATIISSSISFLAGPDARLRNTQAQRYAPSVFYFKAQHVKKRSPLGFSIV